MSGIFMSYRRADSERWCRRLCDHLTLRFGEDLVFRDVDDLAPGVEWAQAIDDALKRAEVALVLIGPAWLSARQRRRLADASDVLRHEIAMSLRGRDRKVIPVLVGGASMPRAEALPEDIRPLCAWQACPLRDRHWRADVERLVGRLRDLLPAIGGTPLQQIQAELQQDQERYFATLDRSPAKALALARETLHKLDRVCPRYPTDDHLQLVRGYTNKNVAMALLRLGRREEATRALAEAERTFRTAIAERPRDAGAWNGLGSVEAVRGDLGDALKHVRKALALEPAYPEARHDETQILRALGREPRRRAGPLAGSATPRSRRSASAG